MSGPPMTPPPFLDPRMDTRNICKTIEQAFWLKKKIYTEYIHVYSFLKNEASNFR